MRRTVLTTVLVLALACAAARADDWHSEQPAPPAGTTIGVPVPLGAIGDIAFWAPNRGLLTTAGNDAVPAGLYAYDGTGWYQLSTVCGGHDGRIAWAAPNEWWTIADQAVGQQLNRVGVARELWHRSLCHFVDGRVVGSYAEPIGVPSSYEPMNAAACNGPDDCWFAGDPLPGTTNVGAFHLHWDGHGLTAVPSLTTPQPAITDSPDAVEDLAFQDGHLFESVQVSPAETSAQPFVLYEISEGSSSPFVPVFGDPIDYGTDASPSDLSALRLSSDGAHLWAVAGAAGTGAAHVNALQVSDVGITQLPPLTPPDVLPAGTAINDLAAEPGADAAWVAFARPGADANGDAQITQIHLDGAVDQSTTLPAASEGLSAKGAAARIACPAAGQCWMATTDGWLFHLGGALPQDTDPAFHQLITFRPPDDGVPFLPPDSLPIDSSGADQPPDQTPAPIDPPLKPRLRPLPLAYRIHERMIHGTTLELTFSLRAKAHVRLVAKRHKRVVARTRQRTLARGRHLLRLRLNPKRWPTSLDLQAHSVGTRARG